MRILYFGDIVARSGRDVVLENLPLLRREYNADAVLINADNAAHGFGTTPSLCKAFFNAGADVILTGNHTWNQAEIIPFLDENKHIIRPINYGDSLAGRGVCTFELPSGKILVVAEVLGAAFMESVENPIEALDKMLQKYHLGTNANAIVVDLHAETTAEKNAFGFYLDGKVSAALGTHTHVQTADAQILPNGTAYITDVGMCGAEHSVIGFDSQAPIARLSRRFPSQRLSPSTNKGFINAVFIETDDNTGLATHIESIFRRF